MLIRIFYFFKILYSNFRDKEWWILYEVNNTFKNLIKVSWHDSKEALEEYKYHKKGKSEIEIDIKNKIIRSITEAVFVYIGPEYRNILINEILKILIEDEKFFQDNFGDIFKKCVDSKVFDFLSEMEILERVGCFIAFNYSNGIDLNYMISRKNEYFERRMRYITKSACDELFLNNKKGE